MVASLEKTNVYLYNLLTFVKCFLAKYKKASKATHRTVPPYFAARFGFFLYIYSERDLCNPGQNVWDTLVFHVRKMIFKLTPGSPVDQGGIVSRLYL